MIIKYHKILYITIDIKNDNNAEFYEIKDHLITKEKYIHNILEQTKDKETHIFIKVGEGYGFQNA
jgi:hypothetical protein